MRGKTGARLSTRGMSCIRRLLSRRAWIASCFAVRSQPRTVTRYDFPSMSPLDPRGSIWKEEGLMCFADGQETQCRLAVECRGWAGMCGYGPADGAFGEE